MSSTAQMDLIIDTLFLASYEEQRHSYRYDLSVDSLCSDEPTSSSVFVTCPRSLVNDIGFAHVDL